MSQHITAIIAAYEWQGFIPIAHKARRKDVKHENVKVKIKTFNEAL